MRRAILLHDGRTVEGDVLVSAEADFDRMMWSFLLDGGTRVGAGEYIIIHTKDLVPSEAVSA